MTVRLDGALAKATGMGRKDARQYVNRGAVTVNGEVIRKADFSVSLSDEILFRGEKLDLREHLYVMLCKPEGTVCTTEDVAESVLRLFPDSYRKRLFCVGRLDKDTTGLLLLTDDGDFDHRLMSPKHHAEKEYAVTLAQPLKETDIPLLEGGMTLENGETTRPCRVEKISDGECRITLCEGKYHQVKRMFAAVGNRVTALRRIRIGNLPLDPTLADGEWRDLTEEEIALLSAKSEL